MLVFNNACVGNLPFGIIDHGYSLVIISCKMLFVKLKAAIGQGPKLIIIISINRACIQYMLGQ